jgi:exopolysaccharide/PEP-CTERM locus tyrosine autokinase
MSKIKEALEKAKKIRGESSSVILIEDRLKDQETVDSHIQQSRVLQYSRESAEKHNIVTLGFDLYNIIEGFKLLKTQILTKTQVNGDRTILVTSCLDGEGKTFNSLNLAVTFAREIDQTVLLVDANFKNPSILAALGIHALEGLTDYLVNDNPMPELLIRPGIEKLVILPAGTSVANSTELLGSVKMQNLISEMKNRYQDRYIFFDGPSILTSVDAIVLSKYVDKVLLVIESGKVAPQKMVEAISLVGEDKILGTILNKGRPA